jgi:hypothetical protein
MRSLGTTRQSRDKLGANIMKNKIRVLTLFLAAGAAASAFAGDSASVKCGPNQERVWVYDSLTSFDVATKLKCNESVAIIGRVKGYVKVHTQEGTEGFVPDSAFSNLPPFEDENDKQKTMTQIAAWRSVKPETVAASAANPTAVNVAAVRPAPVAETKPVVVPKPQTPPSAAPVAEVTLTTKPSLPPEVVGSKLPPPVTKPNSEVVHVAPAAPPAAIPAPAKPVVSTLPATHTTTVSAKTSSAGAKTPPTAGASTKTASNKSSAATAATPGSAVHTGAPSSAPAVPKSAPAANVPTVNVETSMNVQPMHETPAVHPVKATTESEDYPDFETVSESADPACQVFFSAYGLAPSQFKWIAQNRKKKYPNICPSPDTSRVDFVLIFTHDVDVYSTTMPALVHTDHNGFSDFSPMNTVDNAVLSASSADKSKRDYVWVFQMKRGAFDPAKFSPRRRPQFTKAESNSLAGHGGGPKAVEDAFHFMLEQPASR